jgi:hypothetical protein
MKCSKAQDLIYLNRPGELTGERRQELQNHLASCPTCAEESKAALEMEKRVSELRGIEPRLEHAAHLTRAIMMATAESRQRPTSLPGTLPRWTVTPAFRIAACVALLMMSGSFLLQTAIDARKVATLEEQLKSVSTTPGATGYQDIQRAGLFLSDADRITALPGLLDVGMTDIRQWQKEAAMSAMLETLFGRQSRNGTTMIDYLAKKHPRLASVRIDDGIDDREREILASDGKALIKDMEILIQKGGVNHER